MGGTVWKKILRYYDTKAVRGNSRISKSDLQYVILNCLRQDNTLNIGGTYHVILNLFQNLKNNVKPLSRHYVPPSPLRGEGKVGRHYQADRKYTKTIDTIDKTNYNSNMENYSSENKNESEAHRKELNVLTSYRLNDFKKKIAFTLAEVLITLGIIGIVAAMTIPTLISNYQKKQRLVQLKNSFSVVSNAIRLSEVDNGPMSIWPTGAEMDVNAYWVKYLKPYFANPILCATKSDCGYDDSFDTIKWGCGAQWNIMTSDARLLFKLKDGTIVFLPRNSYEADGTPIYVSSLYIDVNGASPPNECAKDVFVFKKTEKGIMPYPASGRNCRTSPSVCADAIMKNGWEYPEDYPY